MAVRFVNETLVNDTDDSGPVTVVATNAYQKTGSGWRLILHHASPGPGVAEDQADDYPDTEDTSVTLH